MINSNNFEYFLNAIHYSLWIGDMKFGDFMGKVVDILLSPIPKYLFTKEYKTKYYERRQREQKKIDKFFYDKEYGYHIGWAHHWFGYFYSGYSILFSFLLGGFALRELGNLSNVTKLAILAIPIGLCYIPAYRAVFAKDRYQKYFRQFKKEDEHWHRKWKRITFAFCIGSIVTTILGICAAFAIAIV